MHAYDYQWSYDSINGVSDGNIDIPAYLQDTEENFIMVRSLQYWQYLMLLQMKERTLSRCI